MAKAKRKEIRNIRSLVNALKAKETGLFTYQGLSVQIGHTGGRDLDGRSSKQRKYWKMKSRGRCVKCEKKVTKRNPQTGMLYRLCHEHRRQTDWKQALIK